jgi:Holliday junction resolvase RusA-like endonuclease
MIYAAVLFDTPPSVNAIWKPGVRDFFKSKPYRAWSKAAATEVMAARAGKPQITGPIEVVITARRHSKAADLDNIIKPLLDALQHGQLIANDRQVERITALWASPVAIGDLKGRDVRVEVRSC